MDHPILQHHSTITSGLLLAGLFPIMLNFSSIFTFLYYMILIPPAIFQCYRVMKDQFIPEIRLFFHKKLPERSDRTNVLDKD